MQSDHFEIENLSTAEQDALSLSQAAEHLELAKASGAYPSKDGVRLIDALNHNLEIWMSIRALAQSSASPLPAAVRGNLVQLSDFVAKTTFTQGASMSDSNIDTLININMQLSEGLREGNSQGIIAVLN